MAATPDLSVIVVTHNGADLALATLRSALGATGGAAVEWLVVDAGSTDATPEAIEDSFPAVRVIRRPNRGFAASNNVGLAAARGRYVLLLNPDVEIRSGTLAELVAAMDARPALGLASVVQRGSDGDLQPSIRRFPSPARSLGEALGSDRWPVFRGLGERQLDPARYAVEGRADWLVGAFLIARREAVEAVGPLDERFFLYSEEIDWARRFWAAGWPVAHLTAIEVTHHAGGRSSGDLMAQAAHSRLLFAAKHYGRIRVASIRAALALGHALRTVAFAAAAPVRPGARERARAERAALRVVLGRSAPPLAPAPNASRLVPEEHRNAPDPDGRPDLDRFDDRHFLEERYRGASGPRSRALAAYYAAKPLLPRPAQIAMRRAYAKRQAQTAFPRWPVEPLLVERRRSELRAALERCGGERLATLANWPDGNRFAAILTHDVEGPAGVARIGEILAIERRHGFASSWNFVAEWYPIEAGTFDAVRAAGGEIGLHAIKHDGKLFESRANFEADLPAIGRYLADWDAVGFRSPATHRNADWMPELGAGYDSSFPDTDPFEPQGGGCCSILPFFLGDTVELPITLVQDHTLWEILRRDTIDLWTAKSDWIAANGGLVNLITHPDYLDTPARLRMYEEFLAYLNEREGGWHALPRDVAAWWRTREGLRVIGAGAEARIAGEGAERARLDRWRAEGAGVALDAPLVAA
jgi:GT2 family glycosyltransferase